MDYVIQPADVLVEDVTVQEEQGTERLVLGRGADVALNRQGREKLCDLILPISRGWRLL